MKKTAALIMASAMMICSFVSCSNKDSVVGTWEIKDLNESDIKVGGIEFMEGGKGAMFMDTTNILHAEGKNIIIGSGEQAVQFDEDIIKYDGTALNLTVQGTDILSLEKQEGDKSEDNYDGKYLLKSGVMYDTIVGKFKNSADNDKENKVGEDVTVYIELDGSSSDVTLVNIFNYTVDKKTLNISGYASFLGTNADGSDVKLDYEIDGDIMKLTSESGVEELKKVK